MRHSFYTQEGNSLVKVTRKIMAIEAQKIHSLLQS